MVTRKQPQNRPTNPPRRPAREVIDAGRLARQRRAPAETTRRIRRI
ncbi:hypothetical protein [Streptomyces sp. NPDC007063]